MNLVPVSAPNSGTVVETAQSRAGWTSMRWIASVSPGSAPSTKNGPVCGLMNGYVMVRLGRSSLDRIRPAEGVLGEQVEDVTGADAHDRRVAAERPGELRLGRDEARDVDR